SLARRPARIPSPARRAAWARPPPPRHWAQKPGAGPGGPPSGGPPAGGPPAGGPPPGAMIQQYQNKITQPPSTYIKRMFVDTASFSVPALMANIQTLGADHVLFGTDSPPLATPLPEIIDLIKNLPIPEGDRQKIFTDNAKRLFKLGDVG